MDGDIESFRDQVRKLVAAEMSPHLDEWRQMGFVPREAWRSLAQFGALLPEIDERYGGSGANLAYQLVVQEELARAEIPPQTSVNALAAHYILDYGSEEQKLKWLPKLACGDLMAGIALTEPNGGSDLRALRTRARRDGGDYVIDGTKMFITGARSGNLLVVAARTGEAGGRGISLIVVETEGLPGFAVSQSLKKIGMLASDTTEVSFGSVRVPTNNLLGPEEGHGFAQLMSQLPFERMLIAVNSAAVIDLAVELTVDYTKHRRAFGNPLSDLQNTRFKLAECATAAHIVRVFVNDCIQRLLDGKLDAAAAYMAKWWCTEQQCKVVDECLQLFGGYGYMSEYPIARLYADSRAQKIYGGTNEIMKDLIARSLFA